MEPLREESRETFAASKSTSVSTSRKTIYHQPGDRGPRHARFPEINVSATADNHGMSKSQLSRLLNGDNRPSMKSIGILSEILGKTAAEVIGMFQDEKLKPHKPKLTATERAEEKKEKAEIHAQSIVPYRPGAGKSKSTPKRNDGNKRRAAARRP
jgi:transcriptional regulator with XRE-family HTH domain